MPQVTKRSDLPDSEQFLIELCQNLQFGRIENLHIRSGVPVFEPDPRLIATRKLDGRKAEGSRPNDIELKRHHHELFALIRRIGNGVIQIIHIHRGLPVAVEFEQKGLAD